MKRAMQALAATGALGCASLSWAGGVAPARPAYGGSAFAARPAAARPAAMVAAEASKGPPAPAPLPSSGAKAPAGWRLARRIDRLSAEREAQSRARRRADALFYLGAGLLLIGIVKRAIRLSGPAAA